MPKGLLGLDDYPPTTKADLVRYDGLVGEEFDELCRLLGIPVREDYQTKREYEEARRKAE